MGGRKLPLQLSVIAAAALVLVSCTGSGVDRHGSDCPELMRDRVGRTPLTVFWDYTYMRGDDLLIGDESEIGISDFPGVPIEASECVLQLHRDQIAYLNSSDASIDPPEGTDYERQGSEVGTRLDFTNDPPRGEPYTTTDTAFELLIEEGSYAGMIVTGPVNHPEDPVGAVGIAQGEGSPFDLVAVRVDDNADRVSDEEATEMLARWGPTDGAVVRRDKGYIVLRAPFTGDPKSWSRNEYLFAAASLAQWVSE